MKVNTHGKTINSLEDLIEAYEEAREDGAVFDLGDGLKGKVVDLIPYKEVHGIDEIVFQPEYNDAYLKERRRFGDDFTVHIKDYADPWWTEQVCRLTTFKSIE